MNKIDTFHVNIFSSYFIFYFIFSYILFLFSFPISIMALIFFSPCDASINFVALFCCLYRLWVFSLLASPREDVVGSCTREVITLSPDISQRTRCCKSSYTVWAVACLVVGGEINTTNTTRCHRNLDMMLI